MTGIDQEQDRLIAAYIRGTADPEAVARLEEAMLDDDELFERVQKEALLQRGLKTTLMESDSPATSKSTIWRWPGFALIGTLGLAVVVLGGWIVQLQQQIDHLQAPQTGIPVITLHDQRSLLGNRDQATLPAEAGPVLIEIDVSAEPGSNFQLQLITLTGEYRWNDLVRDERGYITVLVSDLESPAQLRVAAMGTERYKIHEIGPPG